MARSINKVVYAANTLIDLTYDTVTEADVRQGVRFHLPNGKVAYGTYVAPASASAVSPGAAQTTEVREEEVSE